MLQLRNFHAGIPHKEIIHGIDLTIKAGQVHAVMGPNGAGKTTLAMSLMGHPHYELKIEDAEFSINDTDMKTLLPEERARAGLFISFQSPVEITGVSFLAFLRTAHKALYPEQKIPLSEFKKRVREALASVSLSEEFMQRSVNEGFSGGERKRAEIAQLLVLRPQFVILDEIDSGLDIDSLKIVAEVVNKAVKEYNMGVLIITHYQRILHFLKPNFVHVLVDGKIKRTGKMSLVKLIEKEGYAAI